MKMKPKPTNQDYELLAEWFWKKVLRAANSLPSDRVWMDEKEDRIMTNQAFSATVAMGNQGDTVIMIQQGICVRFYCDTGTMLILLSGKTKNYDDCWLAHTYHKLANAIFSAAPKYSGYERYNLIDGDDPMYEYLLSYDTGREYIPYLEFGVGPNTIHFHELSPDPMGGRRINLTMLPFDL